MGKKFSSKVENFGRGKYLVEVTLIPETWIIAPIVTEEQLRRWYQKGWISEEDLHLDRAFPRNADGKPVIFKLWLLSPMKKACDKLGYPRDVVRFSIIEDNIPVEYIVIPDKPLKYRRVILTERPSTETFEYIDSTYELKFTAETMFPKEFVEVLTVAGKIGLMGRTKVGFGKFRARFKVAEKK